MQNEASRNQTFSSLPNLLQFMQDHFLVCTHCLIWQYKTHRVKLTIRLYVWISVYIVQFGSNHATERQRTGPDGCLYSFDNGSQDGVNVAPKICHFWNNAKCCQNFWSYQKIIQSKAIQNLISHKNLTWRICSSPPLVELDASKNLPFPFQSIIFKNWKMFDAPSSTPGGDTDMRHWVFVGNLILDNFYLKHFSI